MENKSHIVDFDTGVPRGNHHCGFVCCWRQDSSGSQVRSNSIVPCSVPPSKRLGRHLHRRARFDVCVSSFVVETKSCWREQIVDGSFRQFCDVELSVPALGSSNKVGDQRSDFYVCDLQLLVVVEQ